MKKVFESGTQKSLARLNASLLWKFIVEDTIGARNFRVLGERKHEQNTLRVARMGGMPKDVVEACMYYPGSNGPYPHNFKEFWEFLVTGMISDSSTGVIPKAVRTFFLHPDMESLLLNLRDAFKEAGGGVNDIEKYAEAPPKAPLGQIAFSPDRIDKVPKTEKNVDVEDELYDALVDHVHDNIPLAEEDIAIIKSIMKKGYYSKIFKAPDVERVYRGMTIDEKWLRKILKLSPKAKLPAKGSADVSFYYRPRKGAAMSWTRSKRKASSFTGQAGSYDIIFTAITEENVNNFLDLSGLYKVNPLDAYAKEKEVLGLVRVKVSRIEWVGRK